MWIHGHTQNREPLPLNESVAAAVLVTSFKFESPYISNSYSINGLRGEIFAQQMV